MTHIWSFAIPCKSIEVVYIIYYVLVLSVPQHFISHNFIAQHFQLKIWDASTEKHCVRTIWMFRQLHFTVSQCEVDNCAKLAKPFPNMKHSNLMTINIIAGGITICFLFLFAFFVTISLFQIFHGVLLSCVCVQLKRVLHCRSLLFVQFNRSQPGRTRSEWKGAGRNLR